MKRTKQVQIYSTYIYAWFPGLSASERTTETLLRGYSLDIHFSFLF